MNENKTNDKLLSLLSYILSFSLELPQ